MKIALTILILAAFALLWAWASGVDKGRMKP